MPETESTPTPSKTQIFLRRLASTAVLWTGILAAMFSGNRFIAHGVFVVLVALLALTGLIEFYGLAEKRGLKCFKVSGVIGGVLLMVGTFLNVTGHLGTANGSPARVNDFETSFLILFVLGLAIRQLFAKLNPDGLTAISVTLFGLMYVPWLLNFIQKIFFFPGVEGRYFLLYFILLTKFSDMGAYVVGSLIGRHSMNLHHAIVLGIILSITAVIGDLIESLFKRECGAKDSGNILPGIGGILDLLDSLLFNAPIMYLYLRHVLVP